MLRYFFEGCIFVCLYFRGFTKEKLEQAKAPGRTMLLPRFPLTSEPFLPALDLSETLPAAPPEHMQMKFVDPPSTVGQAKLRKRRKKETTSKTTEDKM